MKRTLNEFFLYIKYRGVNMKVQTNILLNLKKMNEASVWKRLYGPKEYRPMDQSYQKNIVQGLFPLFNAYGYKMMMSPIKNEPGFQLYLGYDKDYNELQFYFYNQHINKKDYRESNRDLLCEVRYNGKREEVGVIDLNSKEGIDSAFELITMTLEKMKEPEKAEDKEEEDDPELADLINFKKNLSEQELIEIEVE